MEKKLTWDELQKIADAVGGGNLIKARKVKIPKYIKHDRITISKERTRERLGIWND